MTALETEQGLIPLSIIENTLRMTETCYKRKPLTGENSSPGVIITDRKQTGEITTRLTNESAPHLLYLITGKMTDEHHIPETRTLYQQTLEIDLDKIPTFSILEQEESKYYRTEDLTVEKFTLTQEDDRPLKLILKVAAPNERTEIPKEEIPEQKTPRYFYLEKELTITATLDEEIEVTIDVSEELTTDTTTIKAYTREEYEPNRYGEFQIETEIQNLEEKSSTTYRYQARITAIKTIMNQQIQY
ncbi:MAG: hypothetical protein JEY99_15185 [Spirochaetales bacterium]|nr:hypothetical protein [Spirochaetales bacterium]